jgi:hypothetical protein
MTIFLFTPGSPLRLIFSLNKLLNTLPKSLFRKSLRILSTARLIESRILKFSDRFLQAFNRLLSEKHARYPIYDRFKRTALSKRNHETPTRLCFYRSNTKILIPGKNKCSTIAVVFAHNKVQSANVMAEIGPVGTFLRQGGLGEVLGIFWKRSSPAISM